MLHPNASFQAIMSTSRISIMGSIRLKDETIATKSKTVALLNVSVVKYTPRNNHFIYLKSKNKESNYLSLKITVTSLKIICFN